MDREAFKAVADLIRNDPVFAYQSKRPQRSVEHQLAVFLIRMGGELALKTSTVTGTSEGITFVYCQRVCKALRRIKADHISWPGRRRRQEIREEMGEMGFPGCLGACDGSLIRFLTKPPEHGESFYCRKKFYGVSLTLTCLELSSSKH
jgi:hypothetical protein